LSYFLLDDLRRAVGRDLTLRFLDDNGDGEEDEEAIQYLQDAVDSQIEVRLGRLYSVDTLRANTPPTIRAIGTDLALAMMGERRPEFDGADGKSQFWMRGKRATDLLISIQKGDARLDIDANPAKPGNVFGGVRVPSSAETKPLITDGFIRNGSGDF